MKKILFSLTIISALVFSLGAQAQENAESDNSDTLTNKDLRKRQDLFFVDLTWDYLFGMPANIDQKYWGRGVNLGLMYDQPLNKTNNISLGIGAGFQSHNYYTDAIVRNSVNDNDVDISEWFVADDSEKERGKISLNYVDVPFELRFRTNPDKRDFRWKFAVGGKVGYLIQAHEKIINDEGIKVKYYNYPTINKVRYGVTARVGYGSIMLTSFYSLFNMFNQNHTSGNQNAFSLGISIVPF